MRMRRPIALVTAGLLALGAGACQDDGADEPMPDEDMDDEDDMDDMDDMDDEEM